MIATGHLSEVVAPHRLLIAPAVLSETLWVYADDNRLARIEINEELIRSLHPSLKIAPISDPERSLAISLTSEMGDGEAETLAIAHLRSFPVCTDDHAALRVASRISVKTITTLDLLSNWATTQPRDKVRAALRSLRKRANYLPPRTHHLREWFIRESAD